jgi:hypothetical protein
MQPYQWLHFIHLPEVRVLLYLLQRYNSGNRVLGETTAKGMLSDPVKQPRLNKTSAVFLNAWYSFKVFSLLLDTEAAPP